MAWYWIIALVIGTSAIMGAVMYFYGFLAGMSAAQKARDYEFGKN